MRLTVLVTDDSAVMRAMIVRALRVAAFELDEVIHACNGAEALGILEDRAVDLVIVDVSMPVMSGLELLAELQRRRDIPPPRTLVVSSEGSAARLTAIRGYGAEFVRKPFTPESLRDAVLRATGAAA